jgi:hypothetical protein
MSSHESPRQSRRATSSITLSASRWIPGRRIGELPDLLLDLLPVQVAPSGENPRKVLRSITDAHVRRCDCHALTPLSAPARADPVRPGAGCVSSHAKC